MSFLLDPPLLAASGAVTGAALPDGRPQQIAGAVTVGAFIGGSLALYMNVPQIVNRWPLFGSRSGREFMITSGIARINERKITKAQHAGALSLFALYPLWFELGRRVVKR